MWPGHRPDPDNNRHGILASQFAGPVPPVPGDQLIAAVRVRAGNGRDQHAVLPDAVGGLHHGLVILDLEGVVLERMQLGQGDFQNLLPLGIGAAFLGRKTGHRLRPALLFSRCFSSFITSRVRFL